MEQISGIGKFSGRNALNRLSGLKQTNTRGEIDPPGYVTLGRPCETCEYQGWEFAHRFSKRIARFLQKKMSERVIHSKNERFAHLLIFSEQPERFAHIALLKRGNERIAWFF